MDKVEDDVLVRIERVETQLALHRLAADYCVGADQQDLTRWRAVRARDAV